MPDGCLEVVACAGNEQAKADLLGQRATRQAWDAWLATCEPVGELLVGYDQHDHEQGGDGLPTWVPDLPPSTRDGAWQANDELLAPLRTRGSGLLGVISVDLPHDGLRPGVEQLELLEMYAAQASVAVENAALHSTLRAQDEARSRALGRLSAVVDSAPVAIVELDLDGRVQLWNDAAERIFGWPAEEVLGSYNPVAPPEQYDAYLEELRLHGQRHRHESLRSRRDGTQVDVELTSTALLDADGQVYGYLGVYVDVGHRRQLERELRTAAFTDPLTGLANRAHFTAVLAEARPGVHIALVDLDGFKDVNDTRGHPVGDQVLVEVASRLRSVCRHEDLLARLGGDEFVVLLTPSTGDPDTGAVAGRLARRMLEVLAERSAAAGSRSAPASGWPTAPTPTTRRRRQGRPSTRPQRGRRCCGTRTWRCTPRRQRARGASGCSTSTDRPGGTRGRGLSPGPPRRRARPRGARGPRSARRPRRRRGPGTARRRGRRSAPRRAA